MIRRGSVVTRVYRVERADKREVFTAAWRVGRHREVRQFTSYVSAYAEAALKAEQLAAGKINAATLLSGEDGAVLVEARRLCGKIPVLAALKEWATAGDLTGGQVIAAAEAWKARNGPRIARKRVSDVVDEFCRASTAAGHHVAEDHASIFASIKTDLGGEFIDLVNARKLGTWLAIRKNAVSRNTYRKRIVAVWRWAQKQGYLPRDTKTEAEQTERAREEAPEIGIIGSATWATFLEMIRVTDSGLLAPATIAGFCGLRPVEIHGQTWEDVNLAEKFLRVTRGKRGTPSRRLVPLCDAAVEWLMLCPNRKGPIGHPLSVDRMRKLARDAKPKIELPENCFRHAYISNRVAVTGTVAETALESGNSPQIVHRHYRELVTKAEGAAWFAVRPSRTDGKVVEFA